MQTVVSHMVEESPTSHQAAPNNVTLQDAGRWPGVRVEEWESDDRELGETTLLQHAVVLSTESTTFSDVKWVGGKTLPTRFLPGTAALLPASATYSIKARTFGIWRGVLLFIDPSFLQGLSRASSGAIELVPFTDFADPFLKGATSALVTDIREGYPSGDLYGETIALAVCRHLLRSCASTRNSVPDEQKDLATVREQMLIDYVQANLASRVSLADMAKVADCDPSTVCRFFKKRLGVSPHQFLMRCRVDHAKSLLLTTRANVGTVALECGFASQSHFTESFRRAVGISPARYREWSGYGPCATN